jgi:hypothetical protein
MSVWSSKLSHLGFNLATKRMSQYEQNDICTCCDGWPVAMDKIEAAYFVMGLHFLQRLFIAIFLPFLEKRVMTPGAGNDRKGLYVPLIVVEVNPDHILINVKDELVLTDLSQMIAPRYRARITNITVAVCQFQRSNILVMQLDPEYNGHQRLPDTCHCRNAIACHAITVTHPRRVIIEVWCLQLRAQGIVLHDFVNCGVSVLSRVRAGVEHGERDMVLVPFATPPSILSAMQVTTGRVQE